MFKHGKKNEREYEFNVLKSERKMKKITYSYLSDFGLVNMFAINSLFI